MEKRIRIAAFLFLFAVYLCSCKDGSKDLNLEGTKDIKNSEVSLSENVDNNDSTTQSTNIIVNESDRNVDVILREDGRHIREDINCEDEQKISIDAMVDVAGVENVRSFSYMSMPLSDDIQKSILEHVWGDGFFDAIYDSRNKMWTLQNSDAVGNYYRFTTSTALNGTTEEIFNYEYRNVDLYPFEDNLLNSVEDIDIGLSVEEAISICNNFISVLPNCERYVVDYILPFGNNGRRQYYWIVFKQQTDGMRITAYEDLKFLVDKNGIEHISGSLYDIGDEIELSNIISLDDAIESLKNNAQFISVDDTPNPIFISKISMEYLVLNPNGTPLITPIWRFQLGTDSDQRNILRERIIAINANTGELIQERRRHTF